MIRITITYFFLLVFIGSVLGQEFHQVVRGTVIDVDSHLPLIGAEVVLQDSNPVRGTTTDVQGVFRLEGVPIGRCNMAVRYLGYESKVMSNIIVNSAKEVILEIALEESIVKMQEVVITADRKKGDAVNEMALLSARSISPEETNRYAGSFNDPSRIAANFAGVATTGDGGNDIIIRGNSPKYIQWRLEGMEISNPNHFADQNAAGGSISSLNNNLLAASDFYTGAFTAEFGDVLSGVYDVRFRAGNNEKYESVFGFGLLGTDFTFEGPFKKGYGGSFLVNYRYSTAGIISDLGLIDVNGVPKYQDAAFKVVLPTNRFGTFSFFGLGGYSTFLFEDVKPEIWNTPGNQFQNPSVREDYRKGAHLANLGVSNTLPVNDKSYIKTSLSFANEAVNDDVFESEVIPVLDQDGNFLRDSILSTRSNFISRNRQSSYRASITYHNKINSRSKIQAGVKYGIVGFDYDQSHLNNGERFALANFDEKIQTVRSFASYRHRFGKSLSAVFGVHNMNVLFNRKSTLEPRIAVKWKATESLGIFGGYGNHSKMEKIHNYFSRIENSEKVVTEPNRDLDLLKAHHYVVGAEKRFGKNYLLKGELYCQRLYNLPVENNTSSFYATINEGLEFNYVDLVNEGHGKNYGVELTLERFFNNEYYFLANASIFQSKYTALDGLERNTQYNGNYLVNFLIGKEFSKWGRNDNQTLNLNAKAFFGGGKKIIPLLRDEQGNLAVDPDTDSYWDYTKAYTNNVEDVYQITLSASYKWNLQNVTHELFLNIENITNSRGRLSEYYDVDEPGDIGYLRKFGIFPNLMYRLYF